MDEIVNELAEQVGTEVALGFLNDFSTTCGLLSQQPEMGWPAVMQHPRLRGIRTLRVSGRFDKYLVFYVLPGKSIEVVRVVHGAKDLDALFSECE